MKVYVTQGHERGIGLEVFFKTIAVQGKVQVELASSREAAIQTLKTLGLPFEIFDTGIYLAGTHIEAHWIEEKNSSFASLRYGMEQAEKNGVLFTLPTTKDKFPKGLAGHTEFFRQHYHLPDLGMFFSSPDLQVLLVTDHTSIALLPEALTEKLIFSRLENSLRYLHALGFKCTRVLISGLNPHAGEGGLIGSEDARIHNAINRLRSRVKIELIGPFPGDTMLLEKKSPNDLLVYMFHDQGLGVFKGLQGFIGSNITLGLPFPRLSPDHGTSFSLFGKNAADYRGCAFSLKQALQVLGKVSHGKNSGHQGEGSQP